MNTTSANAALEKVIAEQGYCKLYFFRALIHTAAGYRNLELYASSRDYARRMAESQIAPTDSIVSLCAMM